MLSSSDLFLHVEDLVRNERKSFYKNSSGTDGEFLLFEAFVLSNFSDLLLDNPYLHQGTAQEIFKILREAFYQKPCDLEEEARYDLSATIPSSVHTGIETQYAFTAKSIALCVRDYINVTLGELKARTSGLIDFKVQNGVFFRYLLKNYNHLDDDLLHHLVISVSKILKFNLGRYHAVTEKDIEFSFMKIVDQYERGMSLFDTTSDRASRRLDLFNVKSGNRYVFVLPPGLEVDLKNREDA